MMNQHQLRNRVSDILLNEWDPIGIREIPEAYDEYRMYEYDVLKLVIDQGDVKDIFDYLRSVELERMELEGREEHTWQIASVLHALKSTDQQKKD